MSEPATDLVETNDALIQRLTRERDEARAVVRALHRNKPVEDPDFCQGCGGCYRFDTSIPSERWNAVIRANDLPEYLCTACIVREFIKRGESFTATLWGVEFNGEEIAIHSIHHELGPQTKHRGRTYQRRGSRL